MRIAVVAVGDELLLGEVVDTNTGEIGRRLLTAGGEIVHVAAVPDDVDVIAEALRAAVARADLVVVTGGLGPTSDDVTEPALRQAAGPAATVQRLANPVGSADGLCVVIDGVPVVAVPGVPGEMRALVEQEVLPRVAAAGAPQVRVAQLRLALVGESDAAARIAPVVADLPPGVRVAYLAGTGEVRVRFVGTGDVDGPAGDARELLGDLVVATGDESLEAALVGALLGAGATVATAESLTGGLLGAALTTVPGSSAVYAGGIVAYATRVKTDLLDVDAELLAREGAVHPEVARQMAAGVRQRFAATYGVATTGVAGPDPPGGRPVGEVHVAVASPAGVRSWSMTRPGTREVVRRRAVVAALELVRRSVLGLPPAAGETGPRESTG